MNFKTDICEKNSSVVDLMEMLHPNGPFVSDTSCLCLGMEGLTNSSELKLREMLHQTQLFFASWQKLQVRILMDSVRDIFH